MAPLARHTRVALFVAALAAMLAVVPSIVWTRSDVREVRVVARGMQYYVEGSTEPNPVLRLRRGEQVRVTLRNEDRGMTHDFRIPRLDVGTALASFGEEKSFSFRVPRDTAALQYACTPHSAMMGGEVAVE
jgi:hypothetical protein